MNKNKEETKAKLINAVGDILVEQGYKGLGINKIAKRAGVNKKLIYRYFDGYDSLLDEFILQKDFWVNTMNNIKEVLTSSQLFGLQDMVVFLLEKQLNVFNHDKMQQKMLLLSLVEPNHPLTIRIIEVREKIGYQILQKVNEHFHGTNISFRSVLAVLIGGIYFSPFSEKELNKDWST